MLWVALAVLVPIGVTSSVARVVSANFADAVVVPARERALASMEIADPIAAQRRMQVEAFEKKFVQHRGMTLVHVVPGALFLVFAPLQLVGSGNSGV